MEGVQIPGVYKKGSGKYLVYTEENIKDGLLTYTGNDFFIDINENTEGFAKYILKTGDLVKNLNSRRVYLYTKHDPPALIDNGYLIIKSEYNSYLKSFFQSKTTSMLMNKGISSKELINLKIPIIQDKERNLLYEKKIVRASKSQLHSYKEIINDDNWEIVATNVTTAALSTTINIFTCSKDN